MADLSHSVLSALSEVEAAEQRILDTGLRLMQAADGATYVFDLFAIGALNRAVAMTSAFRKLVADRNMVTAGALVRIHLDTAFRFYASYLVDDRNAFATAVLEGNEIPDLNDRDGERMRDGYLVSQLEKEYPGVRQVYKTACGYVHMSYTHMQSALDGADRANHIVHVQIAVTDRTLPDSFYIDACRTFCTITDILLQLVDGWVSYKNNNVLKCDS
jgi:hypothetical protein